MKGYEGVTKTTILLSFGTRYELQCLHGNWNWMKSMSEPDQFYPFMIATVKVPFGRVARDGDFES